MKRKIGKSSAIFRRLMRLCIFMTCKILSSRGSLWQWTLLIKEAIKVSSLSTHFHSNNQSSLNKTSNQRWLQVNHFHHCLERRLIIRTSSPYRRITSMIMAKIWLWRKKSLKMESLSRHQAWRTRSIGSVRRLERPRPERCGDQAPMVAASRFKAKNGC